MLKLEPKPELTHDNLLEVITGTRTKTNFILSTLLYGDWNQNQNTLKVSVPVSPRSAPIKDE